MKTQPSPLQFACERHLGQNYGCNPYVIHLLDVHAEVSRHFDDPAVKAVALLHDVIEDTDTTVAELIQLFGRHVAIGVHFVTDPKGSNRKEKKKILHQRLKHLPLRTPLIVKMADRVCNVRECVKKNDVKRLKMYAREHQGFMDACWRDWMPEVWFTYLTNILTQYV